jgi:hypothetical protein
MSGSISSGLPALVAWRQLEKNGDAQQTRFSKQATVQQKVAAAESAVKSAKTVDELLNNRRFMEFALSAYGLESEIDKKGLVNRVLKSNLLDEQSLANRMNDERYRDMAKALQFQALGVTNIKTSAVFESLKARYLKNEFEKAQGQQSPGLREALYFRENIKNAKNPYAILGDRTLREVVTKTLDIPREVAIQSVESQAGLLTRKIDITKFQDKAFVDKFIQRYLNKMDQDTSNSSGANSLYSGLLQGASSGYGIDLTGVLEVLQGSTRR